jgi:hypothetical protein
MLAEITTNINLKEIDGDLFASPFDIGIMDAEEGQDCCPEEFFVRRSQCEEYAQGYISVNPSGAAWLILYHYSKPVAA